MGFQADASWLIALFDSKSPHHQEAQSEFEQITQQPSLSSLTLAQLLRGFEGDKSGFIKQITKTFASVVDVNSEIAAKGAQISSQYEVSLSEALIIASALAYDTELLTFDKKMKNVFERLR